MTPDPEQRIVAAFEPYPDDCEWVCVTCGDGSEHAPILIPSGVPGVGPELCLGKTCEEADKLLWTLTADAMRNQLESERDADHGYFRAWADVLGGRAPSE